MRKHKNIQKLERNSETKTEMCGNRKKEEERGNNHKEPIIKREWEREQKCGKELTRENKSKRRSDLSRVNSQESRSIALSHQM